MIEAIDVWVRWRDGKPDEHEIDCAHPLHIFRQKFEVKEYLSDKAIRGRLLVFHSPRRMSARDQRLWNMI